MNQCPKCLVDIGPDAAACPLCGTRVANDGFADPARKPPDAASGRPAGFDRDSRIIAIELTTACLVIAAITLAIVDLILSGRFSWALYPLFSVAEAWFLVVAPLLLVRKPAWAVIVPALSVPCFLAGIDAANGSMEWFLPLAAPLWAGAAVSAGCVVGLIAISRRKGLNAIAYVLLGVMGFCLWTEWILDRFVAARPEFGWSAIVSFALAPAAVLLLYVHARVAKRTTLRKLFKL